MERADDSQPAPEVRSSKALVLLSMVLGIFAVSYGVTVWAFSQQLKRAVASLTESEHDRRELKDLVSHLMAEREVIGQEWNGQVNREADAYLASDRLLEAIESRLALMEDVARWKWNSQKPIEDPEREQALLDSLEALAAANHLDKAMVRKFFLDQIEASKIAQRARFNEWKATSQPPFEGVPDLVMDQRPKIDRATQELLLALAIHQLIGTSKERSGYLEFVARERLGKEEPAGPLNRALASLLQNR